MEEKKLSKWQQFRERMRHTYRLVVMTTDSFEEVASYRISLMNVYLLISSVVVIVGLLVLSAIAFTPLKKYIPGYGDASKDEVVQEAYKRISELEKSLEAKIAYEENIKKMLIGDVQTEDEVPEGEATPIDSITEVLPSEKEQQLQQELRLEDVADAAQTPKTVSFMPRDIPLEQLYFIAPVTGEVSSGFMPENEHFGIDILAPKNTAVKAAADGYIFLADWTLETGNTIGIQHSNNTISFYKHNSVNLKKAGSYIKAGEAVAIIGNTGTLSSGPHLHFELWHKGKPVDPTEYIRF
jgi:murein DD-endopeptidase MepM/ murein hydrolase activator NlpD